MRVCFWGNQDNAGYRLCKWLRAKGINAHLYMMRSDNVRSRPEAIDQELEADGYPEWIRQYDNSIKNILMPDAAVIGDIERRFDVLVVSGATGMMCAHRFNMPMICFSTGPSNQGVVRMWDHLSPGHRLRWGVARRLIRKAVRRCYKILVHYDPEMYSLSRLDQMGKQVIFGFPEDVTGNKQRVDAALLQELNDKYAKYDRVFLWLGRISFVDKTSSEYKGTDKFLEAAERVVRQGANVRIVVGEHGHDGKLFRRMVEEKGLSEHFEWVPHMPFWQLLTYLSINNAVVFDELTQLNCVSSGMFRECLSVGGILVRSYSPILTKKGHGPDCPVLHAITADEVHARMQEVLSWSDTQFRQRREQVDLWAMQYLHWESQIGRLGDLLEETVYAHETARRLKPQYE